MIYRFTPRLYTALIASILAVCTINLRAETILGIDGSRFTLNGKPIFLLGISYYGALGASDSTWKRDLDQAKRAGFNWIRVWATWEAFGQSASAVDADGTPRKPQMQALIRLIKLCDSMNIVVDVTLSRGNGASNSPRLSSQPVHIRAVEEIVMSLKPWRNWYLDLSNERNIRDARYTSFDDLATLRNRVRQLAPDLLVTASHGGSMDDADAAKYIAADMDFLTPHLPRKPKAWKDTGAATKQLLETCKRLGKMIPVHHQEPFRRGYADWNPTTEDFISDLEAAVSSGAAGWCLHNGSTRTSPDNQPRRSFDLRTASLFEQLDETEKEVVRSVAKLPSRAKPN